MAEAVADLGAAPAAAGPPREFAIIPVKGLPIVGAVLVALVAAIAANWLWALDFFHIAGGGLWTGIDLFVGLIVGPIVGRMSVPAPGRGVGWAPPAAARQLARRRSPP